VADHLCPWQSCYSTTQLLGGKSRFVLSNSGHIAALVNPPSNPKASFRTSDANPPNPEEWLKTARSQTGSWWPDYANWLAERSDEEKMAPAALGAPGFATLEAAPGTYVFDR
jgi:polyhydroxyalkanoate synthase subunit PhaC